MTVDFSTEVVGVRDTVALLKKTEPAIFKEFRSKAKFALDPMVKDAQARITQASARNGKGAPLSGMLKPWSPKGRQVFPWNQQKAVKGVKVKILTSKQSFLAVSQMNVAGAVFDIAGRKNPNLFSKNLNISANPSRTMWPAAESKEDEVRKNLAVLVEFVNQETNSKLRY
jgi:hypothetical protein